MHLLFFLSKALENGNDTLLSDSEALTESESDTCDSVVSDSVSKKDSSVKIEG